MIDFVVVCHSGELELKSLLLVWSLKKHLKGDFLINIAIPIVNGKERNPSEKTLAEFKNLDCNIFMFQNEFLSTKSESNSGDKTSNKIYALKAFSAKNTTVFLDSDILALQSFNASVFATNKSITLKPANRALSINWQFIFKSFNLNYPEKTVCTSIDKKTVPPYFNSGVVAFYSDSICNLVEKWEYYFNALSEPNLLKKNSFPVFYRDQIALSLAIQDLNLDFNILDENYNFPVRGKRINKKKAPFLVHYHKPVSIASFKILKKQFNEFANNYQWIVFLGGEEWVDFFLSSALKRYFKIWLELLRYKKYLLLRALSPKNIFLKNRFL